MAWLPWSRRSMPEANWVRWATATPAGPPLTRPALWQSARLWLTDRWLPFWRSCSGPDRERARPSPTARTCRSGAAGDGDACRAAIDQAGVVAIGQALINGPLAPLLALLIRA